MKSIGVHATHCCKEHGCKYGDVDCPVFLGKIYQDFPCEDCGREDKSRMAWISVNERLPVVQGEYLCCLKDVREEPYYADDEPWLELCLFSRKGFHVQYGEEVTHWTGIDLPK